VWARSFLSLDEHAEFTRLVSLELARLDLPIDVDFLRGQAKIRRSGRSGGRINLVNLAQLCKGRPLPTWAGEIEQFFDGVRRTYLFPASILEQLERFEVVRSRLKVRLHPETYMGHLDAPLLVLRKIADGISALLVCDMGFANVSVPRAVVASWGKPLDEIFDIAVANVRAEGRLVESNGAALGGLPVDLLGSESNYAATHLLFFGDYFQGGTGYGALLGVPQRHVLVRHLIRDARMIEAVRAVLMMTDDWYEQGPGAISRELYWWRPGKLERLEVRRVEGAIAVLPSEEFQDVVLERILSGS
jgi:hypothetical protein